MNAATEKPLACTGARARRLTRRLTSFYEAHLRDSGLKLTQYSLLMHLDKTPRALHQLASLLELDRTTLTRSLKPLIEQGWVAGVVGPDARCRCVVLTAEGRVVRQIALRQWCVAQRALEDELGRDYIARLNEQLEEALLRLKPLLPEEN